jgi:hypothetical protein
MPSILTSLDRAVPSPSPAPEDPGGLRLDAAARWSPAPLRLDPWTVLRMSRYRRREEVVAPIWEAAAAMATRAEELAEPRAALRRLRVTVLGPDRTRLGDRTVLAGRTLVRLLAGCATGLAFVLTLGPRLEAEAAALAARRELLEAFLLDTAGWAAIEAALRALRQELRAHGRPATHHLGPGHADWPLDEQRSLVALVAPPDDLVRVSADGLLVPFKSVSGVFGLGPD